MSTRSMRGQGWGTPAVGVVIGVLFLVLFAVRGDVAQGLIGLLIIVAYLALLLGLRRRSESAQLLNGSPADERQRTIATQSSAVTGLVLIAVLIVGMLVSVASGSRYQGVFVALCAVAGVTYVASTVWLTRHR